MGAMKPALPVQDTTLEALVVIKLFYSRSEDRENRESDISR